MSAKQPLTSLELERLWRWQRQMIRYYAAAMAIMLVGGAITVYYVEIASVRRGLLGLVLVLVAGATFVQFRERCPRCGTRLGSQTRLFLPERCRTCRVAFDRPP